MPVSASLHQNGSQERPASLTSTTSSSGSSRDSRGAMEEPSGSEALAENGEGSPCGQHLPNSNNNSSGWLRGSLSPFSKRTRPVAPADKFGYLGRVVREIVETERTYVRDLRSIVEVRLRGAEVGRNSPLLRDWGWPLASGGPVLGQNPTSTHGRKKVLPDMLLPGSASLTAPARDAAGRSHRLDLGVLSVVGPAEFVWMVGV